MSKTRRRVFLCALLVTVVLSMANSSSAATPRLFFSDMTDGPTTGWEGSPTKGAAVSIWGLNFGTYRGTATVSVCGVDLNTDSDFAEWGANTQPTTPRGLQRTTFWLKSTMTLGPGTIRVTSPSGTSESIPFSCRALGGNRIYFFSQSGSDANSGLNVNAPKKSTTWARQNLTAGDVAYFRSGTWTAYDIDADTGLGGGIFTYVLQNHNNGVDGRSITLASYPGEMAQLGAAKNLGLNGTTYVFNFPGQTGGLLNWWTISKFKMEATTAVWEDSIGPGAGSTNVRVIGNDASTAYNPDQASWGSIFEMQGGGKGSTYRYVYGNYLHDPQSDTRGQTTPRRIYCMYLGGYGSLDYIYVGWNEMGWNNSGRAFQTYGHKHTDTIDHLYLHDNYFHDTSRQNVIIGGGDDNLGPQQNYQFVKNAWIYNNVFYNPGPQDVNLQIGGYGWGSGGNYFVYNNTIIQPNVYPTLQMNFGFATFKNNIVTVLANAYNYITCNDQGNGCAGVTGDHNLWFGAGTGRKPSWDISQLDNVDPQIVAAAPASLGDFGIRSTSPCIRAGTSALDLTIRNDIVGLVRPANPSIGAFEYEAGNLSLVPPILRIIQ